MEGILHHIIHKSITPEKFYKPKMLGAERFTASTPNILSINYQWKLIT